MRVLVAAPSLAAVGGVAVYTAALVADMVEARHFDQWWPLRYRSSSRAVRAGVHGIGLARWAMALHRRRPDVVHLQVTSPGISRDILYLRMARQAGVPAVAHLHTSGFVGKDATERAVNGIREVVLLADAVIVMSQAVAGELAAIFPGQSYKMHAVPNPVPVLPARATHKSSPTHPSEGATCRLLCVGEISAQKGQGPLAHVVARLAAEGLDVHLELVGPLGHIPSDDRLFIESCPAVTLSGVRRGVELTACYQRSDAFVLFSQSEAEPLAILEAMSYGLPVIATSVGSIPATLAQAGAGNKVVAADDTAALSEALRYIVTDSPARKRIGKANRHWVHEERSMERHIARLREVYATLPRD